MVVLPGILYVSKIRHALHGFQFLVGASAVVRCAMSQGGAVGFNPSKVVCLLGEIHRFRMVQSPLLDAEKSYPI